MITVVDYGMGNLGSILNMFKRVGVKARVSSENKEILQAQKILLPGVGKFDAAMAKINETGLKGVLDKKALEDKVPVLGICLGMQLLTDGSDEGKLAGLGWISARTHKFPQIDGLKVPHMGWNKLKSKSGHSLTETMSDETKFYFVHSYHVQVNDEVNSLAKTNYGIEFDSMIVKDNIFGAQFHPEKSHRHGMDLFKHFSEI
ncbi:imidazole glycerol phosphate synthase [Pseudoalteromonas luteoviolacea]|nr:imidazole glycerol phosphate synthase [Pseudoalteromonas luteoviolacea]